MINPMTEGTANIEARENLIFPMTSTTENPKAINAIKIKIVGNTRNRTRQTYR